MNTKKLKNYLCDNYYLVVNVLPLQKRMHVNKELLQLLFSISHGYNYGNSVSGNAILGFEPASKFNILEYH